MPNKSVHLTRGAGAPLAGKLRRYAGTLKARSALGSFALRARFPKTLRGKATVNPRNFGQPWIPAGEQSGLLTRIAATETVSLCERMKADCVSRTRIGYPRFAANWLDTKARFFQTRHR